MCGGLDILLSNHTLIMKSCVWCAQSQMSLTPHRSLVDEEWFHGVLPREEVVRLLRQEGDFLVRETTRNDECQTVLSVCWGGHKHFIVQTTAEVSLFNYLKLYIHTHTHTYIYIYIYTHTHTFTYIHTYTHVYIHTHTHTHTYTYIHTYIRTYTHILYGEYLFVSVCIFIQSRCHDDRYRTELSS